MSKQTTFTLELESELRGLSLKDARLHKYQYFLEEKVNAARVAIEAGNSVEHDVVKSIFVERRAKVSSG